MGANQFLRGQMIANCPHPRARSSSRPVFLIQRASCFASASAFSRSRALQSKFPSVMSKRTTWPGNFSGRGSSWMKSTWPSRSLRMSRKHLFTKSICS